MIKYVMSCGGCDNELKDIFSLAKLVARAKTIGWQDEPYNIHYCPSCVAHEGRQIVPAEAATAIIRAAEDWQVPDGQ